MSGMDWITGLGLGVGLSAACGLRVFVPLLVASAAGLSGWLPLGEGFQWLATWPALTVFAVAAVIEVLAYHVPGLDHALDALAGPAAVIAGTLLAASQLAALDPLTRWALALIAGGGAAGVVQGATTASRAATSLSTAGLGNPLLASAETAGAALASVGTLLWPVLGLTLFAGGAALAAGVWTWRRRRRAPSLTAASRPAATGPSASPGRGGRERSFGPDRALTAPAPPPKQGG